MPVMKKSTRRVYRGGNPPRETRLFVASRHGDITKVRELLEAGVDVNAARIATGITPLNIASEKGHLEIVKALLEAGADVNKASNDGMTPLHVASDQRRLKVVKALVEAGADVNKATPDNGFTPLYIVSTLGHVGIVKALVEAGADVNKATTANGMTPLYTASRLGNVEVVKALVEAGADVNKATTDNGMTPLYTASRLGNVEVVKALVEAGADVNKATTDNGATPLHVASYVEVVKALLEAGTNVNKALNSGETPLYIASQWGYLEIVKALLEAGADKHIVVNGHRIIDVARTIEIRTLLMNNNNNSNNSTYVSNNNNNYSNNNSNNNTDSIPLPRKNMPQFESGVDSSKCFEPIVEGTNVDISSENVTFYIANAKGKISSITCLDDESLQMYKTSREYKSHQCTLDTNPKTGLPMTSLSVSRNHVIGKPLRRLELGQKVYVLDSEFKNVEVGKAYLLEPTQKTIGRIVSDDMLRTGHAVSADHCQTVFKDLIYSIRETSMHKGGKHKRRATRKSGHHTKRSTYRK
jgi:ankyrin repeat protein